MRRIVWIAVGAAGGIFAYKRAQVAIADARERGVVGSAQQLAHTALTAVSAVREFAVAATTRPAEEPRTPGAAAARVLAAARRRNQESGRGLRRDP